MRRSISLDEKTEEYLRYLDEKKNLKSNISAVIQLAVKTLYEKEKKGGV